MRAWLDLISCMWGAQVGGTDALRALCASWHGASPDNVLVTVGASEANFITVASLLGPGDQPSLCCACFLRVDERCFSADAVKAMSSVNGK